jgi:CotH kinase protein/Domain of unknown function (DUF4082)/Chitobiase/beta-hexosaminidase C-terminal domain/Lamin Tail Domain
MTNTEKNIHPFGNKASGFVSHGDALIMKLLIPILFFFVFSSSAAFAATLGNTSEGTFTDGIYDNGAFINANRVQATTTLVVDKMFAKVKGVPGHYKMAIYADNASNPGALLRTTSEVGNAATGWHEFPLASFITLTAGSYYWFAIWSDDPAAEVYASTGTGLRWAKYAYGAWPEPLTLTGGPAAATYCLYAQSQVVTGPVMAVKGNNIDIQDGDSSPSVDDGTDFGNVNVASGAQSQTFIIYNPGTAVLTLTGSPLVEVGGSHAADFIVTAQPTTSTLASGGASTSFSVEFNPSAAGTRSATLTISNSVKSFDFAITGMGINVDASPQSLFLASKTGGDSGAEGQHYELGTIFRPSVAGDVTHLRVYALASETGVHTARLCRNTDNAVIAGPFTWTYGGTTGWITLDIPDITLQANLDYTVTVSTGTGGRNYPFVANDFASAGSNGRNLSYPINAGVFTTAASIRPTSSFSASNYLRDIVFIAGVTTPPTNGPVQITEFMADNKSGLQDEDLAYSDWIELYNPTALPINLSGYQLTDGTSTWTFPAAIIGSQRYLVVFASAKNRSALTSNLHTNFSLSSQGEYLALKNASGATISEFAPQYPAQRTDFSCGRNANGDVVYFEVPSPGYQNGFSVSGFVDDPAFSVKRGFYSSAQSVVLTTSTAGASIRYTLDGSTPTATTGTLYTAPLGINTTTTLRARAFKPDFLPSETDTHTYLFLSSVLNQTQASGIAAGWPSGTVNGQDFLLGMKPTLKSQYTTPQMTAALQQVPSISIVTDQANLTDPSSGIYVNSYADGRSWERPVSIELINPDGSTGFSENCGLRIRGGQSRSSAFPKHSFHVNFRSEYGAGKLNFPLFGSDGAKSFDTFDLRCEHGYAYADPYSSANDRLEYTAVRDIFCRDLWAKTGYASTRSKPYHLYLNGQYWGLYQTQERPQEDYAATYFGGLNTDYDVIKATGLPQKLIENSSGTYDAWTAAWNGCRAVAAAPTNANYFTLLGKNADGSTNSALPILINPRELASYMLLHYYTGHSDEPLSVSFNFEEPNNFRAMRRRTNVDPWRYFVHDGESSMLAPEWVDNRANAVNLGSGNRNEFFRSNPEWMHEDLLNSPEYRIAFADEAQRLLYNDGAFTQAKSEPLWDSRTAEINQAVIGESIRWGQATTHNQTNWAAKVAAIKSAFFASRTSTVITQLRQSAWRGFALLPSVNAPTFSQRGGQVASGFKLTLTAPGQTGSIYYSTDGSDPRAIGGAITGTLYTAAQITLTAPTTVRTRFRSTAGEWSALDEASFSTVTPAVASDLVISEFHYHPSDPTPAELITFPGITESAFEFIELLNISGSARDISGIKFTQGITFDFANATSTSRILAAGARVAIVSNSAAFSSRLTLSNTPVIAGSYTGTLSNSGEGITYSAADGSNRSFTYGDSAPWPKDADGPGRSLVLINPTTNPAHSIASNWRPSGSLNGAPGLTDSTAAPTHPLADDDANGFSNLLEYATGPIPKLTLTAEAYTPPLGALGSYYYFRFPRNLNADGITLTAESSSDLVTWTSTQLNYVSTNVLSANIATTTYRTTVPISQLGTRHFFRIKVTQP